MTTRKLLFFITFTIYFSLLANALSPLLMESDSPDSVIDPLSPSLLGESMNMPQSQNLIQEARKAGIMAESNPFNNYGNERDNTQLESNVDNSRDQVNVTAVWSFTLKGEVPKKMKLHLVQKNDVIIGKGNISGENWTENATVSGSISGDKMSLNVMPTGASELYRINLALSSLNSGTYIDYQERGGNRSGAVTFVVFSNIFKPTSRVVRE